MVIATTTILGIPAIPEVVTDDKNLEVTLSAMKEAIEVITGSRGDPNSRAITFGEATENGATDLFITNRVTEAAQNGATSTRLSGDIAGTGLFVEGAVVVPTAIQLPNITRVSGGTPSTTYVGDVAGPYGIEGGYPAGGTTGQVLGKLSGTDDDVAWITQSGGGGGGSGDTEMNNQTGTTYTTVLADSGKMITLSNAASITVTIPQNATVAYPIGTKLNFMQLAAGSVTIQTSDSLAVQADFTAVLNGQYGVGTALKITSTTWVLFGNLEAA